MALGTCIIKRQPKSKRWGVYRDGVLIEGGFFDRYAAHSVACAYNAKAITKPDGDQHTPTVPTTPLGIPTPRHNPAPRGWDHV